MIQIGDILVSEDVVSEYFACDYAACKGACCIEGDGGAPLEEEEALVLLEENYPHCSPLMRSEGRETIDRDGFFTIDRDGDMVTPLCASDGACAFLCASSENGARCALETCFEKGLTKWRKPVSCSLYPIRLTRLTGGGTALNLHKWNICAPAYEKGRREGVKVYRFLEKPLRERFGDEFYDALCAAAEHLSIE
ncbi:MAG: DUF3109 family protein [Bacteroidales bacterium]|nr:DUF3109 family protein [Bacteroidales bacterium]